MPAYVNEGLDMRARLEIKTLTIHELAHMAQEWKLTLSEVLFEIVSNAYQQFLYAEGWETGDVRPTAEANDSRRLHITLPDDLLVPVTDEEGETMEDAAAEYTTDDLVRWVYEVFSYWLAARASFSDEADPEDSEKYRLALRIRAAIVDRLQSATPQESASLSPGWSDSPWGPISPPTDDEMRAGGKKLENEDDEWGHRLAAIRKRLESITPIPWSTTRYSGGFRYDGPLRVYAGIDERDGEPKSIPATDTDAEFIAHAPEDVAFLLMAVLWGSTSPRTIRRRKKRRLEQPVTEYDWS